MKKVLLGLLALSAVSMAAAPDLTQKPTSGTNVFETGQDGAISITGKVTSEIPVVKYVVFASEDNGTTKEDKFMLKDFTLSQTMAKTGFRGGNNPKVYVKRVTGASGSEAYKDLETSDSVRFKLQFDPAYAVNSEWITTGKYDTCYATQLLSQATLQEVVDATKISGLQVVNGILSLDSGAYKVPISPMFTHRTKGVLDVSNGQTNLTSTLSPENTTKIEVAFVGGKSISNAKILVNVTN